MSEWEIKNIQNQLDRLDKKVWKDSTTNFIWLIVLSNIIFWLLIAHISLKHDFNAAVSDQQHPLKTNETKQKDKST